MEKYFNTTLVDRIEVAKDTYEITFEIDSNNFSFVPGQYVWVVLTELTYPDERGNRRAFSIVSDYKNEENRISCIFRKSNSGFKKTLIGMPVGSKVRIDGPFGFCALPQNETVPVIFLAGGVGISSVYTMINYATANVSSRRIMLMYANKSPERAVYLNELQSLQQKNKNFTLVPYFGDLDQETIFSNTKNLVNPTWYIFGPESMVHGIGEILVNNNVPSNRIETEEFRVCVPAAYKENLKIIHSDAGLKKALNNAFNHIILTDSDGKIMYANHGAEVITGYSVKEMIGNTSRLWGGLMTNEFYKSLWKTIKEDGKMFEGELTNRKKSGDIYAARIKISPFFNPTNKSLIGFIGAEEDITKEKEVDRMKTEFISIASHQLRTPLTGIQWVVERFRKKEKLTPKGKEYLDDIHMSAKRLAALVDLLLNLSRIEGNRVGITLESLEVVGFVKSYLDE
ncbi:MAG: histidine kinase dimerization/phospho-acceptor domain-containing protein, partial [bacterium]|nr:histidine kinase dimerization/phospho-acceptor domain-containing protein [bacterium]